MISLTKCNHYMYVCVIYSINDCRIVEALGAPHLSALGFILNFNLSSYYF